MLMQELLDRICVLAAKLPPGTARLVADALRRITDAGQRQAGIRDAMQLLHAENRPLLQQLVLAWDQHAPHMT